MGLAERDFALPDRDRALAEPDRDLLDPLLDLETRSLGLPDARDFGLEEPDLLLLGEPEWDRFDPAGEFDLLLDALEALDVLLERPDRCDFGDSLPDLAGDPDL